MFEIREIIEMFGRGWGRGHGWTRKKFQHIFHKLWTGGPVSNEWVLG